jgi:hypothetical protein
MAISSRQLRMPLDVKSSKPVQRPRDKARLVNNGKPNGLFENAPPGSSGVLAERSPKSILCEISGQQRH